MKPRHSKPLTTAAAPGRNSRTWMTLAAVMLVAAAIVALMTTRRSPTVNAAMPVADTSAPNRFFPTLERQTPPGLTAPEGMVWIPGGEFSMGAQDPRDERRRRHAGDDRFPARASRLRRWLLDGRDRGHQRAVRGLREGDRLRHVRRAETARRRFPGAPPESLVPGSVVFTPPRMPFR